MGAEQLNHNSVLALRMITPPLQKPGQSREFQREQESSEAAIITSKSRRQVAHDFGSILSMQALRQPFSANS
jgi:hypothetical protein